MLRWMMPERSVRYSTLPPLASVTALPTSNVTVPDLGFGMSPRGPRMRPSLPTVPIMSGVAMAMSKSNDALLDLLGEVVGADDVGAGLLGLARLVALGEHGDAHRRLPVPCGQHGGAAHDLVGVAHVDAEAEVDFDGLVELGAVERLEQAHAFEGGVEPAGVDGALGGRVRAAVLGHVRYLLWYRRRPQVASHRRRPVGASRLGLSRPRSLTAVAVACGARDVIRCGLLRDLDAHAAGRALDDLHRGVDVVGVEVGHLGLGDRADLVARDGADLVAVGLARALVDAGASRSSTAAGGVLVTNVNERSSKTVISTGTMVPGLSLRLGVERLAELHDVDAVLAERGAHRAEPGWPRPRGSAA